MSLNSLLYGRQDADSTGSHHGGHHHGRVTVNGTHHGHHRVSWTDTGRIVEGGFIEVDPHAGIILQNKTNQTDHRKWDKWPWNGYVEWLPVTPSTIPICVFTTLTANVGLNITSWATPVQLNNANWALAHGYRYGIFTNLTAASKHLSDADINFHKLRYAEQFARLGPTVCAYIFYVDADAIVNNIELSVEERILAPHFMKPTKVHLMFGTHGFGGDELNGEGCKCNRATSKVCKTYDILAGQWDRVGFEFGSATKRFCNVNAGLFFLRNAEHTIRIMNFWANAGWGVCPLYGVAGAPEQNCALLYLKPRFHTEIDIVPGPLFNSPQIYEEGLSRLEACRKKSEHYMRMSYYNYSSCGRTSTFICHTYGTNATFRRRFFNEVLEKNRHALLRMMRTTGQPIARLDDVFDANAQYETHYSTRKVDN